VFDPPTVAHLEIIESALRIFDRLVVVVGLNPNKASGLFSPEERVGLMDASLAPEMRPYVRVTAHGGLTSTFAESLGACALVRGMRPYGDADAEVALALMNERLAPNLPTVLLVTSATLGGIVVPGAVPKPVEDALRKRIDALRTTNERPTS
jgi:pantetheine-phosphate adenylyltransferase